MLFPGILYSRLAWLKVYVVPYWRGFFSAGFSLPSTWPGTQYNFLRPLCSTSTLIMPALPAVAIQSKRAVEVPTADPVPLSWASLRHPKSEGLLCPRPWSPLGNDVNVWNQTIWKCNHVIKYSPQGLDTIQREKQNQTYWLLLLPLSTAWTSPSFSACLKVEVTNPAQSCLRWLFTSSHRVTISLRSARSQCSLGWLLCSSRSRSSWTWGSSHFCGRRYSIYMISPWQCTLF